MKQESAATNDAISHNILMLDFFHAHHGLCLDYAWYANISALSQQHPTLTAKSSSCRFMCLDRLNALERRPGPKLLCCSTNLNQAGMIGRFWKSTACAVQWLLSISLSNLISLNSPTIPMLTWFSSFPFFPGSVILLFVCSVCDLIRRFLSPLQWLRFILRFHLYL